jgi:hypothetical protein
MAFGRSWALHGLRDSFRSKATTALVYQVHRENKAIADSNVGGAQQVGGVEGAGSLADELGDLRLFQPAPFIRFRPCFVGN